MFKYRWKGGRREYKCAVILNIYKCFIWCSDFWDGVLLLKKNVDCVKIVAWINNVLDIIVHFNFELLIRFTSIKIEICKKPTFKKSPFKEI